VRLYSPTKINKTGRARNRHKASGLQEQVIVRHWDFIERRESAYFFRIQIAVICCLILFIMLFRYWPVDDGDSRVVIGSFNEDRILIPEFIEIRQQAAVERVAPLVPRPEVTVPDEEVVDVEFDLEIAAEDTGNEFGPIPLPEGPGDIVEQPDRPPNVRRIVEPVTPAQARRDGVQVEVIVRYVVSENGEVEEATIEEMRMYNRETGRFETVSETGYGFREITLRAAEQWLFHPAIYQGRPVRSTARHRFTFGS